MVAQAVIAYIIAMIILNGQETEKLKKQMAERQSASVQECQAERMEDCPATQEKK